MEKLFDLFCNGYISHYVDVFVFNIIFSKDIIVMSENMEMLSLGISILSIFVALIGGFMIKHAINLVLLRRKKEIALYFLMGMEENTIIRIFCAKIF